MKRCCTCSRTLPLDAFYRRSAARDGRQNRCKECFRQQYVQNRDAMYDKVLARHLPLRKHKERLLAAYLVEHTCVDCGAADLRVLDFDHRDPASKKAGIGVMLMGGWTWEAMLSEMEKCDVRCANCHRVRTCEQQTWWKHRYEQARRLEAAGESEHRLERILTSTG